ncbi:MAG: hypothetical protein HZA59_13295 [Hydrogenophilales bacterium]|nr:hypothetical protein [Hydrogenophilales bacterium]
MKHTNFPSTPQRQRGAVLAIGLLILVVMTLIGVTGMSTSGLQLKMAGNLKDWHIAFQAVEAGLRDGETDIASERGGGSDNKCSTFGVTPEYDGICRTDPGTLQSIWQTIDFKDSASTQKYVLYGAKTGATALSGVVTQPRYIIEPVPTSKSGESLRPPKKTKTFRVTAVGYGGTAEANIMAQSTTVLP